MEIKLPSINEKETIVEDKKSIVLIGANGAGKTRMSTWIEKNNPNINVHRISAQKSLNMPKQSTYSNTEESRERFLFGTNSDDKDWLRIYGKNGSRWGGNPEVHQLNDFSSLMQYLLSEHSEKSIEFRDKHRTSGDKNFDNITILDQLKKLWQDVIPNKALRAKSGSIEVENVATPEDKFNGSQMSDGEREIFYR